MRTVHIPPLTPVVLGGILTVAAFSTASTQAKPDSPAIIVDSLARWSSSRCPWDCGLPARNELLDAVGVEPFGSDAVNPNGMRQLCEIASAKGSIP